MGAANNQSVAREIGDRVVPFDANPQCLACLPRGLFLEESAQLSRDEFDGRPPGRLKFDDSFGWFRGCASLALDPSADGDDPPKRQASLEIAGTNAMPRRSSDVH